MDNEELNQKYREEGWGIIAEEALGIQPVNIESQARMIARHADAEIKRLHQQYQLKLKVAEIERFQAAVDSRKAVLDLLEFGTPLGLVLMITKRDIRLLEHHIEELRKK